MATRTTPPITGAVPRIEHQQAHREFLRAAQPSTVMVNMVHVRRILKNGHTAASYFPPNTEVISTTTLADNQLSKFQPSQELAMVEAFGPDYHIPTDFPVYGEWDEDRRLENTGNVAAGTLWMDKRLPDSVTTLPLIKGLHPEEMQMCLSVAGEIDAPMGVKYGVQYFTVGGNGQLPALASDLASISTYADDLLGEDLPMLVVGPMTTGNRHGIEKYPENVWAAAGLNAWRKRVEPRSSTRSEMAAAYESLAENVADALDVQAASSTDDPGPSDGVTADARREDTPTEG